MASPSSLLLTVWSRRSKTRRTGPGFFVLRWWLLYSWHPFIEPAEGRWADWLLLAGSSNCAFPACAREPPERQHHLIDLTRHCLPVERPKQREHRSQHLKDGDCSRIFCSPRNIVLGVPSRLRSTPFKGPHRMCQVCSHNGNTEHTSPNQQPGGAG
jgi:hypothetical protein